MMNIPPQDVASTTKIDHVPLASTVSSSHRLLTLSDDTKAKLNFLLLWWMWSVPIAAIIALFTNNEQHLHTWFSVSAWSAIVFLLSRPRLWLEKSIK
jgi:hypothetical protein